MNEDETVSEFHIRLHYIINTTFSLGEKMYEEKLSRKILKSLHKRFDMKVNVIEEAQDLSNIKVDELIGSLKTFEMSINERSQKKNNGIIFVSNTEEVTSQGFKEESLADDIAFPGKKFNKKLEYLDRKWRTNVLGKRSNVTL